MAQPRRKRQRKHKGTQAGTVERAARTGQARTREEAKSIARQRRQDRLNRPPTFKGAVYRAAAAAAIFGLLVVALFGRTIAQGLALTAFMFVLYVPLGFATDKALYRFRQRRRAAARK